MDPQALQELAESIALRGLLQPIMVRPREGGGYEIIYGERRWRAHKMMGRSTIPALIRNTDDLSSRMDRGCSIHSSSSTGLEY
jgi:ParB family chromosome partitioning protein